MKIPYLVVGSLVLCFSLYLFVIAIAKILIPPTGPGIYNTPSGSPLVPSLVGLVLAIAIFYAGRTARANPSQENSPSP